MDRPGSCIRIDNLTVAFGAYLMQRDLDITVRRGDFFIVTSLSGRGPIGFCSGNFHGRAKSF